MIQLSSLNERHLRVKAELLEETPGFWDPTVLLFDSLVRGND